MAEQRQAAARESLRARKKRETRQRISDVATALFAERGFDAVTVSEVARAADVSAMTVFNHFPRKEDLFLDRIPEAVELVTGAVRDRSPGETPLAALRRTLLRLADEGHPLGALHESGPRFARVVLDSAALRARAREGVEEVETALAGVLREAAEEETGEPDPRLTAALAVAAYRTVFTGTVARLLAGAHVSDLADGHRARLHAAFDALERAVSRPPSLNP
ncbi:TetR/AcrR family transcriptional regulator [Streptomyces albiaxialis]|uniref:TetR/AcrR family transcriptional regulator n=1 Tax=Streptomyces albiaxialis TaxID=329523 RepID=A0ABP5I4Z6_9ACTN